MHHQIIFFRFILKQHAEDNLFFLQRNSFNLGKNKVGAMGHYRTNAGVVIMW